VGLNAQFYRAATPGPPCQVAIQRGVRMYHDQTTRPLNDIRWELFTLLSHGAFVTMVDKTGFDGWLDPVAYQRIGAAFKEVHTKRAHFGHRPVYDVGLYFSSRTRDWIGRENAASYFQSFQGAHKACVLEHLQFGVLFDENASLDALKEFPVVCLPNAAILSEKEVSLFRRYVEEGGKLLVTGQSGQFDRMGRARAESAISGLIGARAKGRLESMDNWVRLAPSPDPRLDSLGTQIAHAQKAGDSAAEVSGRPPLLVKGPASIYEPTTARPLGQLLRPHRTTRQLEAKEGTEWPMSADAPVGPAILINDVGKGTVLTLACSPDFATGSEHPIVEARKLFRNAVRFLHSTPRVHITAPANVEAVVTDDPAARTLRIHFVAYNPTPQTTPERNRPYVLPGLVEDAPMFKASVVLSQTPRDFHALNPTTMLNRQENRLDLTISDLHEVVVIRY